MVDMNSEVEIETYMRLPDGFVRLVDVEQYLGDAHYVSGAIVLSVNGKELLSLEMWDDVNWLWPFVVQSLDDCLMRGVGERYFPSQPILFRIASLGSDRLLVSVKGGSIGRNATVDRITFVEAIAAAALEYFKHEGRLLPGSARLSEPEVARIKSWMARP